MFWHLTNLIFCLNFFYSTMPGNLIKEFYEMTGSYLISVCLLTPILMFLLSMTISRILIKVLDGYGIKPV